MTFERKTKGYFRADFPLSRMDKHDAYFVRCTIHQKIRQHDTAVIRVRTPNTNWIDLFPSGAPVKITYRGQNNLSAVFVGYVTNVQPVLHDGQGYYLRDIVCVAASRELRKTARATYRNKTAPEIVTAIAKKVGFKVMTTQHGLRRPTVVHSGETYWEFLTKLAKRSGYVLRVEGTTIMFMPLKDMVRNYSSRAPYLTDYLYRSNAGLEDVTIHSLESWGGDTSDDPESLSDTTTYTSIAPATGDVRTVRKKPTSVFSRSSSSRSQYHRYPHDVAVHSRSDAVLLAKGAADNGSMAFDTRLRVTGQADIAPYRPVILDVKDLTVAGKWVVKEVTHVLGEGLYHCDVVVSTDSVTGSTKDFSQRGMRKRRDVGREMATGYAPDIGSKSRLKVTRKSPADGPAGSTGRWVAR